MMQPDQVKSLLDLEGVSGKFVLDEDGNTVFEPTPEELTAINAWIAREHEIAEEECEPLYREAAENLQTYKATETSDIIEGEMPIVPAPLARIAVDQVVAWMYNTIMRPTPIVSFQPYFDDQYEIVVPPPQDMAARLGDLGVAPEMGGVAIQKESAEDAAYYIERGYDYKLRESLRFSSVIRDALTDMATVSKAYVKVCYEKSNRIAMTPARKGLNNAIIDFGTKQERYVRSGESVRWYGVPFWNILKRNHVDDLDEAEVFWERTPCSPEEFRGRCLKGEYALIKNEEIDALAAITSDVKPETQKQIEATTQNKITTTPRNMIDMKLTWFYRYVKFKEDVPDPMTGEMKSREFVRRVSLMGDWHAGARRMCSIFRNPSDTQLRPYAVGYQLKDPHTDSGSSTTSISKFFQKTVTHLLQAEIKNAYIDNNISYWYDPDGPAATVFNEGKTKFHPGMGVGARFGEGQDWGVVRAGNTHGSLVQLINLLRGWAREVQNMSTFESGDALPSRTPSSSISQILQQGLQQPLMFLRAVDEFVCHLITIDMEMRRQYEPLGEVIPTRDAKTKALVNIPFMFPMGEVARNFRIALTAADEALAKEHEPEQLMMLLNVWQQLTQFIASVLGPMKEAMPEERAIFMRIIEGAQSLFDRIVTLMRTDVKKFDISTEVETLVEAIAKMQEEAQMAAQQASIQQGGMVDPNQAANAGPIPGPQPQANTGGSGGMAEQPVDQSGAMPPPEGSMQEMGPVQ